MKVDRTSPSDFSTCDRCHSSVHIDELGFKPTRYDRWWWYLLPASWARDLLDLAACEVKREGETYGGFCGICFGPGYEKEIGHV